MRNIIPCLTLEFEFIRQKPTVMHIFNYWQSFVKISNRIPSYVYITFYILQYLLHNCSIWTYIILYVLHSKYIWIFMKTKNYYINDVITTTNKIFYENFFFRFFFKQLCRLLVFCFCFKNQRYFIHFIRNNYYTKTEN